MGYRSVSAAVLGMLLSGAALVTVVPAAHADPVVVAPPTSVSAQPASPEVGPLATVNLGLSTQQAKNVQCWLRDFWDYNGAIDGQLGTNSWKAFQRNLKTFWGYTGPIDGVVGGGTVSALQRLLKAFWGYTGNIDGQAGPLTQAAFKRFANAQSC